MEREALPINELILHAYQGLAQSYAPYSGFRVGAALLSAQGSMYTGGNIENAAYTPTNCAERTAFFKAVSEGARDFQAICIVNEDQTGNHNICPPCGVCLQVMMEFCSPEKFFIILAKSEKEYVIYKLKELLPLGFGAGNLKKGE